MAVALVLFVSTVLMPIPSKAILWNDAMVSTAVFAASLFNGGPNAIRRERELYGRS